jgi:putative nucleotide binding protein
MREEYGIILDVIPYTRLRVPIAQIIGTKYFTLLEVSLKDSSVPFLEKVYIGKNKRDVVEAILKRIKYDDLTPMSKMNIKDALRKIVEEREEEFVKFINEAKPISPYAHSLELLPRIGKKLVTKILEEREKKPFESFEDFKKRLPRSPDIKECIVERLLLEIMGQERVRLFIR